MPKVTGTTEYDGLSPATRRLLESQKGIVLERAYLGIDPGSMGGMTVISKDGRIKGILSFKEATLHEIDHFISRMQSRFDLKAALENVHSMPKQGVAAMFTFGKNVGHVEGIIVARKVPYIEVTPQRWQRFFSIPPRKTKDGEKTKSQHKRVLQEKAHKIYPAYVREITLAVADSVLIAEWLRCDLTVLTDRREVARLGMEGE